MSTPTFIYRVIDESGDVEPEYAIEEFFSTEEKAREYIQQLAEDWDDDPEEQERYARGFSIYRITLDNPSD